MLINFIRIMALTNAAWLAAGLTPWNTGDTFDAALYASTLPLFWTGGNYVKWWFAVDTYQEVPAWEILGLLGLLCMLPHFGGTAWLIVIAQLFALLVQRSRLGWAAIPLSIAVCAANYGRLIQPVLVEHKTRLMGWATYLDHWWNNGPIWIGFGADTFRFRAPMLEVNGNRFIWAHNDFVEVLFDTGFVGLAVCLVVLGVLIRASRNDAKCFSAIFGFIVCMTFYSPLQVITGQLIALAIAWAICRDKLKELL